NFVLLATLPLVDLFQCWLLCVGHSVVLTVLLEPSNLLAERITGPTSHLAKPNMTAEHIGELFHVNASAAELRKASLERIDRRTRDVHRLLPEGVADWLRGQERRLIETI